MPYQERWTAKQKDLLYSLVAEENLRVAEAVEICRKGSRNLEPFEMPMHTAYKVLQKERKKRSGQTLSPLAKRPLDEAIPALQKRCVSLLDLEVTRQETKAKDDGTVDLQTLERTVRVAKELASATKSSKTGDGMARSDSKGKSPSSAVAKMLRDHRQTFGGAANAPSNDASPPESLQGTTGATPNRP